MRRLDSFAGASGNLSVESPDPDRDLVDRACAGDRNAFEALLRRHYDRMYRLAWRLTGSTSDAEDIAQEVCCKLVEKLAGFSGQAKFSTWLFGIVVNASRDYRRRNLTLARIKEQLSVLANLSPKPDGRDLYRRDWLVSALSCLAPHLRETVVLVACEGLTHAEAALILGVAESTVSWRMHEVRRQLAPMAPQLKEVPGDL